MIKIICQNCGIEKREDKYYLLPFGNRMKICKDCFEVEIIESQKKTKELLSVFRKYDLPFVMKLWNSSHENIREYMRYINSLPQYRNLRWKDSQIYYQDYDNEEKNFYDEIVDKLKQEAKILNQRLENIRNNPSSNMNEYIATLKSLKEVLHLISEYDWMLHYSEYGIIEDGKQVGTQISVWEQNHDNQIRNHKVWTVLNDMSKHTKETGIAIGNSLNGILKE